MRAAHLYTLRLLKLLALTIVQSYKEDSIFDVKAEELSKIAWNLYFPLADSFVEAGLRALALVHGNSGCTC